MLLKFSIKKIFMVICLVIFVFVGNSVSDVEAADVSDSSKLLQIEKIKFVNDEIVLISSSKVKEQRKVSLDFDFYTYETINGNTFIADVIGNHQNLINLSLESNPSGYIINIAFYDKITGEYSYYFGEVDEKIIRKITSISQPSSVLDDQYAYLLHNSTKWYMSTFDGNLVSNSDISISKNETEQLLQKYYSSENNNDALIKDSVYANDVVYQEITSVDYQIVMRSSSNDDPVTYIIPRVYFTYPGKKTGTVGSIGYYIETNEWPENSGRYLSDIIVWTNSVYTPSYSSDTARQITKPEFSGLYEYAENGYSPQYTPVDEVREVYDSSSLALRSLYSKITVEVTNSFGNNTIQYDHDEFIYHMEASHNGYRYEDNGISVTGVTAAVAAIGGLIVTATPWPDDPVFWGLLLGLTSTGGSVIDGITTTNNGIMSNENNSNDSFSANFVADRTVHYNINGGKYVRKVYASLDSSIFFAPQNHYDFSNLNTTYTFSAYLEREGTNSYDQKVIEFYSKVKIVDLDIYWWFGTQINETYKATKSMTQEETYYRYYIPYY